MICETGKNADSSPMFGKRKASTIAAISEAINPSIPIFLSIFTSIFLREVLLFLVNPDAFPEQLRVNYRLFLCYLLQYIFPQDFLKHAQNHCLSLILFCNTQ